MTIKFLSIPTVEQWKTGSSVFLATRKTDIVLDRIDKLLGWLASETDAHQRMIQKCDLFFTADFWLRNFKHSPSMDTGRSPAIQALYTCVAATLCKDFRDCGFGDCTVNTLPKFLEMFWGRPLSAVGATQDYVNNYAEYITYAEAAKYRIWFKGGLAYELGDKGRTLLNSKKYHDRSAMVIQQNATPADDYGFFVLTMARDLFMAKHRPVNLKQRTIVEPAFYHSAYVAGSAVQCSGTMLIKEGRIERIRLNSGHYKPHENNMRGLLMALRMWGVAVETIYYEDYLGQPIGDGSYKGVLEATNDAAAFQTRVSQYRDDKKAADRKMTPIPPVAPRRGSPTIDLNAPIAPPRPPRPLGGPEYGTRVPAGGAYGYNA